MSAVRRGLAALALAAAPAAAQEAEGPWRISNFPYLTVTPNYGAMATYRVIAFRMPDQDDRVSLHQAVAAEVGWAGREQWRLGVRGDFPRLAPGWRAAGELLAASERGFGADAEPGALRRRIGAWAEVTRTVRGPLALALRGSLERHQLAPSLRLSGDDGVFPDGRPARESDAQARLALVLDLRDREFETRRGVLVEGGVFAGSADDGYHGAYAQGRGWYSPAEATRFTVRVAARALSRTDAYRATYELPAWERPLTVLGGPDSHRGFRIGETAGRGVLLGGAELRQDVVRIRNIAALTAIAFVDGGRVFRDPSPLVDPVPGAPLPSGDLSLTLDDWHWAPGLGVGVRVLRNAVLTATAARLKGRTTWYVSGGWSW